MSIPKANPLIIFIPKSVNFLVNSLAIFSPSFDEFLEPIIAMLNPFKFS